MTDFVPIEIDTDPEEMQDEIVEYLQTRWPDWEPADSNLEWWLILAISRLAAETRDFAADVSVAILKEYGATVVNIPPVESTEASTTTTWTMIDDSGYTIPGGTRVGLRTAGDELIAFETVGDVVVPEGSTVTSSGEVQIIALDPGADANGLEGTVELIDALSFVSAIVTTAATAGGTDEETDADYLDRLVKRLRLMAPRPILPADFEVLAAEVEGVARVVAIDGWEVVSDTLNNERTIGLVAVDKHGADVPAGIKMEIEDLLESEREVNFDVGVGSPTTTAIDVTTTVRCAPMYAAADVEAAVEQALNDYLDPSQWGVRDFSESSSTWRNSTVVRYLEVAEAINRVPGVDYIESLTVEGGTADVNLPGRVPLTQPGTISATANAA